MKTIPIDKQASVAELANAFTTALATAIGWTAEKDADGSLTGNVKKSGINIYFRFNASGSYVYINLSNGSVTTPNNTGQSVTYSANDAYKLYVFESSGGSIVVGASTSNYGIKLFSCITRNSAGEYVGVAMPNQTGRLNIVHGTESVMRYVNLPYNSEAPYTSIFKLPDIWSAAVFNELYCVMSCPYKNTDRVFTINGKNYRSIGSEASNMILALPEN